MRVLLLVLLFVVWESPSPVDVGLPVAPWMGLVVFAVGYLGLVTAVTAWGAWAGDERRAGDVDRRIDRFTFALDVARFAVVGWFAVGVYFLDWRDAVDRVLGPLADWPEGRDPVVFPGAVVGLLPGFLAWVGLWPAQYPVDRLVRERNLLPQLQAALPVFAPPTFAQYLGNMLRVQLLFTVVPLLLILILRDAATVAFSFLRTVPPALDSAAYLASVGVVLVAAPVILRRVLSTVPLPPSRLRAGLEAVGRAAGVRCREVLVWRTHHNLGNAAVMGLLRQVRYVLLSDLLLASMTDEQVQAVFAHELGHVRHRHLAWFVAVLACGSAAVGAGQDVVHRLLPHRPKTDQACQAGASLVALGLFWVGFGLLSRWFERQADVYAARLMDRTIRDAAGTPVGDGVGAALFASALLRVATVNNIPVAAPNWTHGSIAQRVRYVRRFGDEPAVAARFDRTGTRVRVGLVVGMIACGLAAAAANVALPSPAGGPPSHGNASPR